MSPHGCLGVSNALCLLASCIPAWANFGQNPAYRASRLLSIDQYMSKEVKPSALSTTAKCIQPFTPCSADCVDLVSCLFDWRWLHAKMFQGGFYHYYSASFASFLTSYLSPLSCCCVVFCIEQIITHSLQLHKSVPLKCWETTPQETLASASS